MSEDLTGLPIVEELGAALVAGFRRRETGRTRRPALREGALAAAAAVAGAILLTTQLGGGPTQAQAAAVRVLRSAAATLEAHPAALPRRGQFLFVRWRYVYLTPVRAGADTPLPIAALGSPKALVRATGWTSWSTTRAGETGGRVLGVSFPTVAARALWVRLGRPRLGVTPVAAVAITPVSRIPVGRISLSVRRLISFPANPRTIATRWFAGESAVNVISDIPVIEELPLPAKLRAAIYRALTLVPGIAFVGRARTLDGRVGTAIGTPGPVVRSDLIIDPRNGSVLGIRTVATNPEVTALPDGTVLFQQVTAERVITNRPGLPRGEILDPRGRVIARSKQQATSAAARP